MRQGPRQAMEEGYFNKHQQRDQLSQCRIRNLCGADVQGYRVILYRFRRDAQSLPATVMQVNIAIVYWDLDDPGN